MKIKSAFLLGLSAVALASCGGVKEPNAYKNEVKKADFTAKFIENTKDNALIYALEEGKQPFSFALKNEAHNESITSNLKGSSEYNKKTTTTDGEAELKYDSANKIVQQKEESKTVFKGVAIEKEESDEFDSVLKLDSGFFYNINNTEKTFMKDEAPKEKAELELFREAYGAVSSLISSVMSRASMANEEKTKFYIDDNIYTFVINEKDSNEDLKDSYSRTYLYQLVVNADSIEYFYNYDYEQQYETSKYVTHNKSHAIVEKKDVSVKSPDISKYLDITPETK
ncbi:MAG: hypothetical protein KBS97_00180 [Firmicutes bacterium]|nr:hypothetical protein [Candidatus Fiminaster equi]